MGERLARRLGVQEIEGTVRGPAGRVLARPSSYLLFL